MEEQSGFGEQMPQTIGRYKVQESIGYGAMGAVYKAFDPLIKRTLAIKTIRLDIPRQSPQYKNFIERFYHEARISGTLSHSNIVTLFDIGEEGGIPYLAMEFVEGETIASFIERGVRFKPEKVISLVSQIASAVDYAHSKGVIHRDIKPSNIILFEGERVKVTDFGIAKLVDSEMTQSGTLLGTPSYMSPEQAMGDKLDGRSDIFSLGVCAFEMLSGEQPFPGTNVTSILYKLVHVDPIEPANLEMNGLVPQKWHEVFGKVLAKKPDDRYQTATAFVQDLEYCLGAWFGSAMGEDAAAVVAALSELPVGEAVTKTLPRSDSGKSAEPPEEDAPATVMMMAPVEHKTVLMQTPVPKAAEPPPKAPEPAPKVAKAEKKEVEPPTPATVYMPKEVPDETMRATPRPALEAGETVRQPIVEKVAEKSTGRAPALPAAPPPPPAKKAPEPPPDPHRRGETASAALPSGPPAAARKGLPTGLLLGGAALVVFVLLVGGGLFVLRHLTPAPLPSPSLAPSTTMPPTTTVAPAPTTTLASPTGVIHVESEPAGATVKINGDVRGVTPLDVGGLAFGAYEVKLELKGFEARTTNVNLAADSEKGDVKVPLPRLAPAQAIADILSTPFGAAVTVDGKSVGQTPLTDFKLSPGSHQIQIARDGYEPWSGPLKTEPGKRGRVDVTLKVVPLPSPSPTPSAVDPNHVYQNSLGEVDIIARQVSGSSPDYPIGKAPKLKSGESVSVSYDVIVDDKGDVESVKVTESAGKIVDEAVTSALKKYKYTPAVKQGIKVKVLVHGRQTFRMG